jgi:translation elongation factor EF-1beta
MGKVSVLAKIFPEDFEEIERIKSEISSKFSIKDHRIEDIGFGIKVLKVLILTDDTGANFEEELKKIKGVSEVEIESITLI